MKRAADRRFDWSNAMHSLKPVPLREIVISLNEGAGPAHAKDEVLGTSAYLAAGAMSKVLGTIGYHAHFLPACGMQNDPCCA